MGAEDRYAVERVLVVAGMVESVVDGERRAVAGFPYDTLHFVIVSAAGVGDGSDVFVEARFNCFLGVDGFVLQSFGRGKLAERDMGHRVALDVDDARVLHLLADFPCEIVWIDVQIVRDDEDRAFKPVFLQDRVGVLVIVDIAVVEGEEDGLFGQRGAVFEVIGKFVRRDGMVAVFGEIPHLRFEFGRAQRQSVVVTVVDLVVVEDGNTALKAG